MVILQIYHHQLTRLHGTEYFSWPKLFSCSQTALPTRPICHTNSYEYLINYFHRQQNANSIFTDFSKNIRYNSSWSLN